MPSSRSKFQPIFDNSHPRVSAAKYKLTGSKFGRLTVLGFDPRSTSVIKWVCVCDCGYYTSSSGSALVTGGSKSCGCISAEKMKTRWENGDPELRKKLSENAANVTHRKSKHPLYRIWSDMKQRCFNKKNAFYQSYGGRGITVCERWMKFENFYEDMIDGYMQGMQIGRIDNDGWYSKENCRWETAKQQQRNKSNTAYVDTPKGRMKLAEAAEMYGLSRDCISHRIKTGWPMEKIYSQPSLRGKK